MQEGAGTPRPLLFTADGEYFVWPHSSSRTTKLTAKQLAALLSKNALERVLAHGDVSRGELRHLFGATRGKRLRAFELNLCAQRIRASGLEKICKGLAEKPLCRIFRASKDRRELMRLLLAEPCHEHEQEDADT